VRWPCCRCEDLFVLMNRLVFRRGVCQQRNHLVKTSPARILSAQVIVSDGMRSSVGASLLLLAAHVFLRASVDSFKVGGNLVDSASSHTLVSKIKPCMSKYNRLIL
jgi:hypothetical protein